MMAGEADHRTEKLPLSRFCYIHPSDFRWWKPKMLVSEGDEVEIGTPLFCEKGEERVRIVSPVEGRVKEVLRGEKRAIESVVLEVSENASLSRMIPFDDALLSGDECRNLLMQCGLWPCIRQRPFSVVPRPEAHPKAIFVPCFDSAPLAPDMDLLLGDQLEYMQQGINVLKQVAGEQVPLFLCLEQGGKNDFFESLDEVDCQYFSGPHPAGNVGTQIHYVAPLDTDETVWYIHPLDVARIGMLFSTHRLSFATTFALTGPGVRHPHYFTTVYGTDLSALLEQEKNAQNVRCISGNVLTGSKMANHLSLRFYDHQVTLVPEGGEREWMGWLKPGFKKWSFSHTFMAWMARDRQFSFTTSLQGGRRNFVMTDVYERVFPFEILPLELLKACLIKDLDQMVELGIFEVDDEDFALCEVVCPSKMECQKIVRDGLKELYDSTDQAVR